ncbi:MAG: methyltransferase domain-containing protein [Nevskiaceae bacterium]|nr:MAG: methyltransferase domain-containing protein [Nevskiaceae bacterium]
MSASRGRRGGRPFSRVALEQWLQSPRGGRLLELEEREVRRVLPDVFGRHLLQVGSWGRGGQLIASSETLHSAVIGSVGGMGAQALAAPEQLPVMSKSVDAVLLPHTLEFARTPKAVLREVDRVLTDRGRLLALGFNPWSGWGLRQAVGLRHRAFPPGAHFHSAGRLCDWLELLDFEVVEVRRYGAGMPWLNPHSDGEPLHLGSLAQPFAEAYLVVARKRVLPMTLRGRVQRAQIRPLIGVPASEARSTSATFKPNEA